MRPQRVRRRARLVGLAIVLAAGAAVGLTVSGIGGSPRPTAAPTPAASLEALRAYAIVYTGSDGVQVVSLSGDRKSRPITAPAGPPLQTGASIAFVSSDTLYLLGAPFTDPRPTSLDADRLFPMAWPGTVGVANEVAQNIVRAQYVDLQDKNLIGGSGWELPPGYRPVSQFLATGPGGVLQVLEPGSGGRAQLGPVIALHTVWVTGANTQAVDGDAVFFSGGQGNMHVYQRGASHATTLDTRGSLSFTIAQS